MSESIDDPSDRFAPDDPVAIAGCVGNITYALLDNGGQVLYVGVTANMKARLKQHRYSKPWWPDVHYVTATHWGDDWKGAEAHERRLIASESPTYNNPAAWATGRRNWDKTAAPAPRYTR